MIIMIYRVRTHTQTGGYTYVFIICVQIFIADIKNSDEYFFFLNFYFLIENHPSCNKQSLSI